MFMSNLPADGSPLSNPLRKKRRIETDKGRAARLENRALERSEKASSEDETIDAAIKRSIEQYGA